jgi:hypothetical protein
MKLARVAVAALALLATQVGLVAVRPAHAQMPNVNLIPDAPTKSQEEKDADEARDKAYKDSLRKIPDAKASSDPWGTVRSDAPKSVTNGTTAPGSKTAAAKSAGTKKTKTGSAN